MYTSILVYPKVLLWGLCLFVLYFRPSAHISYHRYADDTQLYTSFHPEGMSKLNLLFKYLDSDKRCMLVSFSRLKEGKKLKSTEAAKGWGVGED